MGYVPCPQGELYEEEGFEPNWSSYFDSMNLQTVEAGGDRRYARLPYGIHKYQSPQLELKK